ncbi:ABC transporter substrate-binding protein [Aggregatibacter actinomycetemcomitans]|uniref:ABC transporter substrate-binding protein n=1 Tax=Aggregatibacter actinomycetemcomitans TaxID=714 RepID=UPI001E345AB1|nr:ABC transporter substrate-binding protein [Aggregatibacter actinomycetemcomitans]
MSGIKRGYFHSLLVVPVIALFCLGRAYSNELVIGTTFSPESLSYLITEWEKQPNATSIRMLNRTSNSLNKLFDDEKNDNIDLVLSSSPMLFYHLQEKQRLAALPDKFSQGKKFVPEILQKTTVAFSLSGCGIFSNVALLENAEVDVPTDWSGLISPNLQGLVIMSSPSRSDTTHIMIEALLQKQGWQQGWALIHQVMANVGTISSRSFGVVDKVQAGLGAAGITIDNYANLLTHYNVDPHSALIFKYFPNFPVSPTFIAITTNSTNSRQASAFIHFLLSDPGQSTLYHSKMGKYPIIPLAKSHPLYATQQFLFSQPTIDYQLLLKRQEVVKLMFEHQIIHRLAKIQENWKILYQKEQQAGHPLPELREILTALPITEKQATDENYLETFKANEALLHWQHFFMLQQMRFVDTVEKL